jgi:hypothetical protein
MTQNFSAKETMQIDNLQTHKLDNADALAFILGGNSTFTLKSLQSGNHFTYKVNDSKRRDKYTGKNERYPFLKFINVRIGASYVYMGTIQFRNGDWFFILDQGRKAGNGKPERRAEVLATQKEVVAFTFVWERLWEGRTMPMLEFWAAAQCCRCGRKLTDEKSIEVAMGPVCGGKHKQMMIELEQRIAQRKQIAIQQIEQNKQK